ncbi:MAG: alpha/beta hydrolase-fold protein [Bacteroidales bacterium]
MNLKSLTGVLLLMLLFVSASGQDGYTMKRDSLRSKVLGQDRKLAVFLPDGYDKSDLKYPVIYVLDADGRDQHTVPTARFLFLNNRMPRAIIVGVFNIDRNHDFLPDSTKGSPTGGGADNFIKFFGEELIPYIDGKYKSEGYNVLVGHSFGGLFAMHCLVTSPDLFNAYIAIDPSFWYNGLKMINVTNQQFAMKKNWAKVLFITGREGGPLKGMGVTNMDSLLKTSAPKELAWKVAAYADEDHGSVTFKSVYDGFRFIFDAGGSFNVYPHTGVIPRGGVTYAFVENPSPSLHYTLDGTEPTAASPVCHDTIIIRKPCTLKVKSMKGNYSKSAVITRVFTEGEYQQGLKTIKNLKPGLKYSYFEGTWDSVPDMTKMKPLGTGSVLEPDLKFTAKKDSFAVRFEGYLHVEKQGIYYFWVTSDDGSKVYINSKLILDNDGLHDAGRPVVTMLPLSPGYYPLVIDYFEKTGDNSVTLGTVDDKMQPVPIAKERYFMVETRKK